MMRWGDYVWGWGMGFGWLVMIGFWVIVILGVVFLVRALSGGAGKGETPLDILKKRYARGEITREEFEKMKTDLYGDKEHS